MRVGAILTVCNFLFFGLGHSLPLNQFYLYGESVGDRRVPNTDEGSTDEVKLRSPFVFYGDTYFSYFINVNGIISFLTEIPYFFNAQFPLDYPVIAPFYSDIDTSGIGNIWYRETSDPVTIRRVTEGLKRNFESASHIRPTSVSIITYDNVGSFQSRRDKMNTFQVLLITDSIDSFIIFNYADDGLQWLQGDGKTSGLPDAIGQAGFIAMDGRLFTLRGSGTDQVRNLNKWSNVDEPGVWMFRVGQIEPGKNIQTPNLAQETPRAMESYMNTIESCAVGGTVCHSSGSCIDYEEGFCCKCSDDYYGNGINCIKKDVPIRVTGKFSGKINDVEIIEGDLHSYVLATEGRTYTAVSRVPNEVGYDLQSLTSIGEGIAWLFAIPNGGVSNGFTLTGGVFNRSVVINFPLSGHKVELEQNFMGLDVFNNVAIRTTVSGSLPTIPIGTELEVDAFKEEVTRVQAGQLRSRSNRSFRLKGQALETPFSVETIINFEECHNAPRDPETETLRFKVAENIFIRFDEAESIVRFSFSAKTGFLEEEDPCIKGREECGAHSQCIVDGDNFRCVCEQGFDYYYDTNTNSTICLDMNECGLGRNLCAANALCLNTEGSYKCQCNRGYVGDGYYCKIENVCENAGCDPNASCKEQNEQPLCKCNVGYKGDGYFCSPDFGHDGCHIAENCSPYAMCSHIVDSYVCICMEGYYGDGYQCQSNQFPSPEAFPTIAPYDPFQSEVSPECVLGYCRCPVGYALFEETMTCRVDDLPPPDIYESTNPKPICAGKGLCVCPEGLIFNEFFNVCDSYLEVQISELPIPPTCFKGTCLCPFGFYLDPKTNQCHPSSLPEYDYSNKDGVHSCNVVNKCHSDGQCQFYGDRSEYRCTCNAGFTGDGLNCSPFQVSCDQVNVCHFNADCIYDDMQLKSVCVCKYGYLGDGLVCTPKDDCSRTEDCDPNAQCQFDGEGQRYICVCNQGYDGSGFLCIEQQDITDISCDALQNCHHNADCLLISDNQYQCQCKSGFEGDGYFCIEIQIDCNILNNCGDNAECHYSIVAQGFSCQCREGYTGDGFYCETIQNCLIDQSICHYYATCERSPLDEFSAACVCRSGYTGDGLSCEKTPDYEKNILIMNQGLSVLRMPINKQFSIGYPILVDPYMTAVGADIDCMTGRYYWTDVGTRSIRSSNYDGTEKMPVISGKIGSPEDVAVDWISKLIYWTDSLKDHIAVSNMKGGIIRTVIKDWLVNPRGIAVHPGLGLLFWSDWNRENPKIEVSAMDGSERRALVTGSEIRLPNSLVVDYETTSLCWADAGTHKIECIGVEGHGRRVIIENIKYPFGLALHQRTFYYTDWNDTSIHEVNKYSGIEEGKRSPPPGGSGRLYGIVAVPDQCPPVSNVCQIGNGGCRTTELCLPTSRGGRTCACSDDSQNDLDQCIDYRN